MKNVNSKTLFGENALDLWLKNASTISDKIVILDNMSDDGTFEKIIKHGKTFCYKSPIKFLQYEQHLHAELWSLVRRHAKDGDMILLLASDEFIDDYFQYQILFGNILKDIHSLYASNIVHMWNQKEFRVDGKWGFKLTPRLFRFQDCKFTDKPLKEGIHNCALPSYVGKIKDGVIINGCIIHYGYSDEKQRKEKHDRYIDVCKEQNDKDSVRSIIDDSPKLVPLKTLKNLMKNYYGILSQGEWDEIKRLMLNE